MYVYSVFKSFCTVRKFYDEVVKKKAIEAIQIIYYYDLFPKSNTAL